MSHRLLFIDVAKGSAIIGVILVHALIHGVWFFPSYAIDALPIWLLAVLSPLVILATWAGFFELMSGLSNGYNMYNRLVIKEQSFKRAAQGPLVNSTGLLIMHFLYVVFFSHRRNSPYPNVSDGEINTMISGSFELGRFHFTDFQFFYFADVLGSIALAGYLSIFILWLLYKLDLLQDMKKLVNVILVISVLFFIVSYPIWDLGYALTTDLLQEGSTLALVLALPLSMLTGAFQPFFPIAGFGLIGVILGLLLSVRYHKEEVPEFYEGQNVPTTKQFIDRYAPISLLVFVVLLINHIFIQNLHPLAILVYFRLPPIMLALNLALMLWIIKLAIILFEEPDHETRVRRARKTTIIRRFGMVTLSVYTFESVINGIVSYQFHRIYDDPATPDYESHVAVTGIFIYLILVFSFWFIFVYLWEKLDFKYGIEYWIIQIGGKFRKTRSSKLDIQRILYEPIPPKVVEVETEIISE